MKNLDFIDESILAVTPDLLKELDPEKTYALQKIASKRASIFVQPGDAIIGKVTIVNVAGLDKPGVKVRDEHGFADYIRTSPILKVSRIDERTLEMETEGGFYRLSVVAEQ